ncbi:MAG: hypothetical protein QY326_09265 [Bdellovibrionota bacterium]|nr:MAG: hypothetical protein QY326_09265 [Bdellovibrionota bacterium]
MEKRKPIYADWDVPLLAFILIASLLLLTPASSWAQNAKVVQAPKQVNLDLSPFPSILSEDKFRGKNVVCLFIPTSNGFKSALGVLQTRAGESFWRNLGSLAASRRPSRKQMRKFKRTCMRLRDQLEDPPDIPSPMPTPPEENDPVVSECSDGMDNDSDGLVDVTNDPGCTDANDNSEASEGDPKQGEVSQWGITFVFDRPYRTGTFANGDYWVAPDAPGESVTIVEILPAAQSGPSYGWVNGWEVNPSRSLHPGQQAFDYRANLYNQSLMPTLPYSAEAGDSIIKAISDTSFDCSFPVSNQCLSIAAVLTVLDAVPPQRGAIYFRPPYVRGDKSLVSINDIRWELLPSLPPPSGVAIPTLQSLIDQIAPVNTDHGFAHDARARAKPSPWYGANISTRNMEIMLRLFLNDPIEEKKQLLVHFVNYGLDLFAMLEDGHGWNAAGGHGHGRAAPIAFAGTMLQRQDIIEALANAPSWKFGETDATYISPITGMALYGENSGGCTELNYWQSINSPTSYNVCRDPYPATSSGAPGGTIDGGRIPGAYYQSCCTSGQWQATFTGLELMPALKQTWNPPAFLQYVKRFLQVGAWTQGDTCAPGRGFCLGGDNAGQPCTTANSQNICTGIQIPGVASKCELDMSQYGVSFGPDPSMPGHCIQDSDPTDGIGRFPQLNGTNQGLAWGQTPFQLKMREQYLVLE